MTQDGMFYTHALWRVRAGQEERFIEKWSALAAAFSSLENPPLWGTLIRNATDPSVFYSFGPWRRAEDVAAMRASPEAERAIRELRDLCDEATPSLYHRVLHVTV